MYQENPKREEETTPLPKEKKRDNKMDMDRAKGTWVDIKFSSKIHERKIIWIKTKVNWTTCGKKKHEGKTFEGFSEKVQIVH